MENGDDKSSSSKRYSTHTRQSTASRGQSNASSKPQTPFRKQTNASSKQETSSSKSLGRSSKHSSSSSRSQKRDSDSNKEQKESPPEPKIKYKLFGGLQPKKPRSHSSSGRRTTRSSRFYAEDKESYFQNKGNTSPQVEEELPSESTFSLLPKTGDERYNAFLQDTLGTCLPQILIGVAKLLPSDPIYYIAQCLYRAVKTQRFYHREVATLEKMKALDIQIKKESEMRKMNKDFLQRFPSYYKKQYLNQLEKERLYEMQLIKTVSGMIGAVSDDLSVSELAELRQKLEESTKRIQDIENEIRSEFKKTKSELTLEHPLLFSTMVTRWKKCQLANSKERINLKVTDKVPKKPSQIRGSISKGPLQNFLDVSSSEESILCVYQYSDSEDSSPDGSVVCLRSTFNPTTKKSVAPGQSAPGTPKSPNLSLHGTAATSSSSLVPGTSRSRSHLPKLDDRAASGTSIKLKKPRSKSHKVHESIDSALSSRSSILQTTKTLFDSSKALLSGSKTLLDGSRSLIQASMSFISGNIGTIPEEGPSALPKLPILEKSSLDKTISDTKIIKKARKVRPAGKVRSRASVKSQSQTSQISYQSQTNLSGSEKSKPTEIKFDSEMSVHSIRESERSQPSQISYQSQTNLSGSEKSKPQGIKFDSEISVYSIRESERSKDDPGEPTLEDEQPTTDTCLPYISSHVPSQSKPTEPDYHHRKYEKMRIARLISQRIDRGDCIFTETGIKVPAPRHWRHLGLLKPDIIRGKQRHCNYFRVDFPANWAVEDFNTRVLYDPEVYFCTEKLALPDDEDSKITKKQTKEAFVPSYKNTKLPALSPRLNRYPSIVPPAPP